MMQALLQLDHVSGGYLPNKPVIHRISFQVNAGEIVALIGLNGAGKSTTIKHILGLLTPQEGTIMLEDCRIEDHPDRYRSLYSYIPETPIYYDELTLWEHLELAARAYGLTRRQFEERAEQLLQEFHMSKRKNHFPTQFSKGMKQKLMIMMAFLVQPKLYIVDEPLLGLDPLGIRSLLNWLNHCKEQGAGVLMSTHILTTAQKYCDRFIIIHEGKIRIQGSLEELRKRSGLPHASLDEIYVALIEEDVDVPQH